MKKNIESNQEKGNLENLNLKKLQDEIKKKNLQFREIERGKDSQELIYRYPENWGKREIGGIEGKGFRNSCRNKIRNFSNLIPLYLQKNRIADMENELKDFYSFYQEKYRLNDFSLSPFSILMKKDANFAENISIMMQIAKEYFEGDAEKKRIEEEKKKEIIAEKKRIKRENQKRKKKEIAEGDKEGIAGDIKNDAGGNEIAE